eukprot:Lithocolla_globosa_v1_NODE_9220_length_732_cov_10.932053.p1 type:complete len:161 gc:universal NODE_9220_length_732_cov_10.932053:230-712(+)
MPQRAWGNVVADYTMGSQIQVEWCVQADHSGVYSYRLCHDEELVSRFTNPSYTPSTSDMDQLESCFQDGILPCTAVSGQDCPISDRCEPGMGCYTRDDWFQADAHGFRNHGACPQHSGFFTRDIVQLPTGFRSNHTLLGFRWDSMHTQELYMNCADISVY